MKTGIDYQYSNDGKTGWNRLLTTLVHKEYAYEDSVRYINKQTVEDITYDEIGNPVSYNYTDYVYNDETKQLEIEGTRTGPTLSWRGRQLRTYEKSHNESVSELGITIDLSSHADISYYYDADGLRSRKNIYTKNESGSFEYAGKTMYQYLGSQLAYQCTYNAAGGVDTEFYFFYDSYDNLTAIRYISGTTDHYYYVTTNLQGDAQDRGRFYVL